MYWQYSTLSSSFVAAILNTTHRSEFVAEGTTNLSVLPFWMSNIGQSPWTTEPQFIAVIFYEVHQRHRQFIATTIFYAMHGAEGTASLLLRYFGWHARDRTSPIPWRRKFVYGVAPIALISRHRHWNTRIVQNPLPKASPIPWRRHFGCRALDKVRGQFVSVAIFDVMHRVEPIDNGTVILLPPLFLTYASKAPSICCRCHFRCALDGVHDRRGCQFVAINSSPPLFWVILGQSPWPPLICWRCHFGRKSPHGTLL